MDHYIVIGNYQLAYIESVEIHKSVDLLTDTAVITVPGEVYNQALDLENKVKVGDKVTIQIGYDRNPRTEFEGYLQRIDTDDSTLTFNCEDAIYLTRKPVHDKQFINASVKEIVEYCLAEIGLPGLNCTSGVTYQKFVIHNATAYDVLKKLQDESGNNIYYKDGMLQIHPLYIEKGGDVVYDFARNIESSDLKYRRKEDRVVEVTVESVGLDGKKKVVTVGTTGGERKTVNVSSPMSEESLKSVGEEELKKWSFDGYEGSITSWLIPICEPTYSAQIRDKDYEYKNGTYYVVAVTTTFSEQGGVRKIQLGKKLVQNG